MDGDRIFKCFVFFIFLFFLLWVIFYTYHPWFLTDEDFIAPLDSGRNSSGKERSDKYLSDPGRSKIFLASLITSIVSSILLYLFLGYFFNKKRIRCKKGGKSLADCDLV